MSAQDNQFGCVYCTSSSNCITHPKREPALKQEEKKERREIEEDGFKQNEAAAHFGELHRKDAEAYGLESRYEAPRRRNAEDTPFSCARPQLQENRRAKGNPPSSVEGNINHFVSAANNDEIEYMINDVDGTQDMVDAALEIIKVNPLTKRVDDGTWIFLPSAEEDAYTKYYGVFKTQTIGFRMTGPRSYLFYTCKTCKKSFKIGYLSKTVNPTAGTETFENDQEIDHGMGIPNKPKYHPKFADVNPDLY